MLGTDAGGVKSEFLSFLALHLTLHSYRVSWMWSIFSHLNSYAMFELKKNKKFIVKKR